MERARQARGISGSTLYSGIKVLVQLLTDYSMRHPNKSLTLEDALPGTPMQHCNYGQCLLHSWHSQAVITVKTRTLKEQASSIDLKEKNAIKIAVN